MKTNISKKSKQMQQTTTTTTNNNCRKAICYCFHVKQIAKEYAARKPANIVEGKIIVFDTIQEITTKITDEVINTTVEEMMSEYIGQKLITKKKAKIQEEELYEELRQYKYSKLKYRELVLKERDSEAFHEAI